MRIARQLPASLLPMLVLAACSGATSVSPSPSGSPMPGQPASSAPSLTPAPSQEPGIEGVVVTFRVADVEEYRVLLTDPEDIAIAEQLLAGDEAPRIPNGRILRDGDGGVNTGYSWHIDPASLEFAEVTIEVCDGLPSYVEDGTLSGDQFCPWSAVVIDIQPAE